jgi:hypothetical protein
MQKPRVNFNYSDDEDNDVTISFRVNDVPTMVAKFNDFLRAVGYLEQVGVVNLKPYTDQIIDDSCMSTMVDHSILS